MREIDVLKDKFSKEPYSRKFNIEVVELKKGYAKVKMKIEEDLLNIFGIAHGGAVFSIMDAAFELASNSSGIVSVAVSMSITFTAPANIGDTLYAEAYEINTTRKTGLYEIKVYKEDKTLIAYSQALVYRKNKKILDVLK